METQSNINSPTASKQEQKEKEAKTAIPDEPLLKCTVSKFKWHVAVARDRANLVEAAIQEKEFQMTVVGDHVHTARVLWRKYGEAYDDDKGEKILLFRCETIHSFGVIGALVAHTIHQFKTTFPGALGNSNVIPANTQSSLACFIENSLQLP
jgi:hypothetical protein